MIKKILLADSGTGQTKEMLSVLMELPAIQKTAVTLLHVVPPQTSADAMRTKRQEGAKTLAASVESMHLAPNQIFCVNTMLREG
ncbi:MAG TPA: hypothetical protein V6D03_13570, partial [Candidatus Caenarcaniphilales bacterium]